LENGIAGGLLITLMQEEKIYFDGKKVRLQDPTLTADPLLNQVLFLLIGSQNNKTIEFWLTQIVLEIKNLSELILDRLVAKGYLNKEEKTVKFGTKIYYKNNKPKITENLTKRLLEYLQNERRPSFLYRGMICLLDSCAMHRIMQAHLQEKEAKLLFEAFEYCPSRRVKKYFFLTKLNEEIGTKNKIHVYA
jgi:hypothetical protein